MLIPVIPLPEKFQKECSLNICGKYTLKITNYRRISQVTYQPKSVGKMADFETLSLCISLNSSKVCTYFFKDLVTGYCLCRLKNSIASRHPFSNRFCYPRLATMGLTLREICVYLKIYVMTNPSHH